MNTYAETPPPIAKLYVRINKQFRECYKNVAKRGKIPKGHVILVKYAL